MVPGDTKTNLEGGCWTDESERHVGIIQSGGPLMIPIICVSIGLPVHRAFSRFECVANAEQSKES